MIREILNPVNLAIARNRVVSNKGASGIDGMRVTSLTGYIRTQGATVVQQILCKSYRASAIKGVVIPKGNGKTRLLGIPTVIDRWLQQAVSQQIAICFEPNFEVESYGFRPRKTCSKRY